MHNNYHFFKHLVPELKPNLVGLKLMECFSQDKNEMILGFAAARGIKSNYKQYFIRCSVLPMFPCLFLTKDYKRAKRNTVNLWESLHDLEVLDVFVFENERAIGIRLENNFTICFKMFGNRANILVFENENVLFLFNQKLKADRNLTLKGLHRELDTGIQIEQKPTLGKLPKLYFESLAGNEEAKRATLLATLEDQNFYLIRHEGILKLSLVPFGEQIQHFKNAIEALNSYFITGLKTNSIDRERQVVLKELEREIKSIEAYINKSEERLAVLKTATKNQDIGHVLMANLHQIPERAKVVELYDFINDKSISIKLKEDLSAQKNAENYYRKAKNEQLEVNNINDNILNRIERLQTLEQFKSNVANEIDIRQLRKLRQAISPKPEIDNLDQFKVFEKDGYTILVGRNAKNNDELTLKGAKKSDLWLHARDVAGSHVVIKHKAGQNFPIKIIEYAAGIALYFSKRKSETHAPVIYTEKKYVRKAKGSPDGQVIVTKESVIMTSPIDPN